MANEKASILKPLLPLRPKLTGGINFKSLTAARRPSKVSPISAATKSNEILLLRDLRCLSLDRQDHDYLQARRAVLSSYHLINDGRTLRRRISASVKGLCRDVGTAVHARVGVRAYRLTVACPWSGNGSMLVFRCFLPHLRS